MTEEQLCNLMGGKTIKDVVTGHDVQKGQFSYSWQNFINDRQEDLFEKIDVEGASKEYLQVNHQLCAMLERVAGGNEGILKEVHKAIDDQQKTVSSLSYMKGFMEGIKLASTVGGL